MCAGHVRTNIISRLLKLVLVRGLSKINSDKDEFYEACVKNKDVKSSFQIILFQSEDIFKACVDAFDYLRLLSALEVIFQGELCLVGFVSMIHLHLMDIHNYMDDWMSCGSILNC